MSLKTLLAGLALASCFAPAVHAIETTDTVLAPLAAPRAEADAKKAKLTSAYLADLEKLEPAIAEKTGNLEAVLRLRKEIEEWKAGRPTPSFAPDDPAIPAVLRARRETFDQNRAEAEAPYYAAVRDLGPQIIAALDELAKETTNQKQRRGIHKVAQELRDELSAATALAAATAKPAPGPSASAPGAAPVDINPLLGGKLHAFGVSKDGQPVDLSAGERYSDLVTVNADGSGHWAAVRAGGDLVSSLPLIKNERIKNAARCDFVTGANIDFLVLHRDGRVTVLGQAAKDAPRGLRSIVDIAVGSDFDFALSENGSIEAWPSVLGRGDTKDLEREARSLSGSLGNVVAVDSKAEKSAFLMRDGTVHFYLKGEGVAAPAPVPGLTGIADIVLGNFAFLALARDGTLRYAASDKPGQDALPSQLRGLVFTAIKSGGNAYAARNADGSWTAWGDNEKTGIPEKINSLGPVIDLAFATGGRRSDPEGFVLWIK